MTLQFEFFFQRRWKRMKYSTIETVPSSAVLILKVALADSWSRVRPYHMPKYRPMGMKMQSRMMRVQNQKMAFLRVRNEYFSGGGRLKSGSSYVTWVWGNLALRFGVVGLLGLALVLTAVVLLFASTAPSTAGTRRECAAVCADAGREGSVIVGVPARNGSVDVCSVAMVCVVAVCCGCSRRRANDDKENGRVFGSSYADANG
jgi:hypothetical protein